LYTFDIWHCQPDIRVIFFKFYVLLILDMISQILGFIFFKFCTLVIFGMVSQILGFIFFKKYYVLLIFDMISQILWIFSLNTVICTFDIGYDQPDTRVYFL
jgi:hypothetical protein